MVPSSRTARLLCVNYDKDVTGAPGGRLGNRTENELPTPTRLSIPVIADPSLERCMYRDTI